MELHPAAVPAPEEIWRPPYVLDHDELARVRAEQLATVPALAGPPLPVAEARDVAVGGVPCRVYRPDDTDLPVTVYAHGGGWIVGSIETLDGVCRRLAVHGNCVVVSVDYRMAPEHRWPAAIDDVDTVVEAVQAGELDRTRVDRVAVAGDSAGGHLATVAGRRARDGGRPVTFQALVYPVTDGVSIAEGDPEEHLELGFSRGEMAFYWDTFVPEDTDRSLPDVSPLHAELAGMPPTLLLLAGHDLLTAEGQAYADALQAAGVDVVVSTYPRMRHGFIRRLAVHSDAVVATDQVAAALRRALGV